MLPWPIDAVASRQIHFKCGINRQEIMRAAILPDTIDYLCTNAVSVFMGRLGRGLALGACQLACEPMKRDRQQFFRYRAEKQE